MSSDQYSEKPLPVEQKRCYYCGELTPARNRTCWLCQEQFSIQKGSRMKHRPEPSARPAEGNAGCSWAIVSIVAALVCAGLVSESPGVLIVLLVIGVPIIIWVVVADRLTEGGVQGCAKLLLGAAGIGLVVLIGLAGIIAFVAICVQEQLKRHH